jgi:hypothetical protein
MKLRYTCSVAYYVAMKAVFRVFNIMGTPYFLAHKSKEARYRVGV